MSAEQKTNATAKKVTRQTLIDDILTLEPTLTLKNIKYKKKAELVEIYESLTQPNSTAQNKVARLEAENTKLKLQLANERSKVRHHKEKVGEWHDKTIQKQMEINKQKEMVAWLVEMKTRDLAKVSGAKELLTDTTTLILELGSQDHLNSTASQQLNNQLLKVFNMLSSGVATPEFIPDDEDYSDEEDEVDEDGNPADFLSSLLDVL